MQNSKEMDRRAFWAETSTFRTAHSPFGGQPREGFKHQKLVDFSIAKYLVNREQELKEEWHRQVGVKDNCITGLEDEIGKLKTANRQLKDQAHADGDRAAVFERAHSCALSSLSLALSEQRKAEKTCRGLYEQNVNLNQKVEELAVSSATHVTRQAYASIVKGKNNYRQSLIQSQERCARYVHMLEESRHENSKKATRLGELARISEAHQKVNGELRRKLEQSRLSVKRYVQRIEDLLKQRSDEAAARIEKKGGIYKVAADYANAKVDGEILSAITGEGKNLTATEVKAKQDAIGKTWGTIAHSWAPDAFTWRNLPLFSVWTQAIKEDAKREQDKADKLAEHNAEQFALAQLDLAKWGVSVMEIDKDGKYTRGEVLEIHDECSYINPPDAWDGSYTSINSGHDSIKR